MIGSFNQYMVILVAFSKRFTCKSKHHNVLTSTNPLLIWTRAVTMAFITSKLIVQEAEAVILLTDDVFKMLILIYTYHTGLY